jgi:hypothetical protein
VRTTSLTLLALTACVVAGAGALSGADLVQATDRDLGVFLVRGTGGWELRRSDSGASKVALPSRLVPYRLEGLSDGWVVTGTVAQGARSNLVVARIGDRPTERLPPPPDRFGLLRTNPVPLVANGMLRGLAWIEGDRHDATSVLAAEWLGDRWGPVETVSPRGPGTQIALACAVLAGGDWLALWSGFDGGDDEIVWSRRSEAGWTAPERLGGDNAVPDITPAVIATRSGALAAWSVYDGEDYRLRLARLAGDAWSLEAVSGARGSLYPQALRAGDRILVVHGTVVPAGWSIVELDEEGGRLRLLRAGSASPERPILLVRWGDALELAWPSPAGGLRRVSALAVPEPREP